ncbi:hypothetical protein EVG20_g11329 [Dentipellis fragilis]|uniref:Uncharacterized protein n=1 Tax=Dentipellis fragilis TaxID=205917 RepID=A0A4Y9XL66_9AGAM|nr:hypothetical protein EVG20_g11329 [Dentipellis fragilis]
MSGHPTDTQSTWYDAGEQTLYGDEDSIEIDDENPEPTNPFFPYSPSRQEAGYHNFLLHQLHEQQLESERLQKEIEEQEQAEKRAQEQAAMHAQAQAEKHAQEQERGDSIISSQSEENEEELTMGTSNRIQTSQEEERELEIDMEMPPPSQYRR